MCEIGEKKRPNIGFKHIFMAHSEKITLSRIMNHFNDILQMMSFIRHIEQPPYLTHISVQRSMHMESNQHITTRAWIMRTSWVFHNFIKSVRSTQRRKQSHARQPVRHAGDTHTNPLAEPTMQALSDRPSLLGCDSVADKFTKPQFSFSAASPCISAEYDAAGHESPMLFQTWKFVSPKFSLTPKFDPPISHFRSNQFRLIH